jgi:hypothetical protein
MKRTLPAAVIALGLFFTAPSPVDAQVGYFGQNKVQYRTFKFQVMKTAHFDVYYYPEVASTRRSPTRLTDCRLRTHFLRRNTSLI